MNKYPIFKKRFNPSRSDIERICRFFSIGKLKHFEKEKGIVLLHANPFVYVLTTLGQYALKFYPMTEAKKIVIEYALNRFLIEHRFPAPVMYTGHRGQSFLTSNDRLATCSSYVNGLPSWQQIRQRKTITLINSTLLS